MIPSREWRNKIIVAGHDISDFVTAWTINRGDVHAIGSSSAGVDGVVATVSLTVTIVDMPKNVIDDLRAPYAPITIKVYAGDEWQYLLDYDEEVLLDYDDEPFIIEAEEHFLFDGYLGDGDNFVTTPSGQSLQLRGRDQAKRLQASFFDEWSEIPPGRIDTVIQAVLNHMVNPPLLYVPVAPSFSTHQSFRPQNQSVWDVAQQVAIQSGWFLGFELVNESWRLVLREPPRSKVTPDYALTGQDVFGHQQGTSDADIRNAVRVLYIDAATREQSSVYREDLASIGMTAGVRQMSVLPLNSTNQVGTQGEAEALADYFIHDMSDPFANTRVDLPLFPEVQFYDLLELSDVNGVDDQDLAVHTIQHSFSSGAKWRTNVSGTHKVVGRRVSWIDLENRPGAPNDDRSPHQAILPPPLVTLSTENPGFSVTVDERRGVDAVGVEIYWSTSQGFVPSPSTLRGRGDEVQWFFQSTDAGQVQITPGVLHYVRVRSYDSQGNYGEWSPELTIMAKKLASNLIVLDGDVEVTGDIDITRPSIGNTGTLRFWKGSTLHLAIGEVGGLFGAPPGATGLAAEDGSGLFIKNLRIGGDTVVTGNVDITNSGNTNYRFQVKDATDNLQLALGNLGGLSLPPAQSYGLYGKLGTGVFIEGMVEPVFTTPVQAIFPQIVSQTSLAVTEFDITQLYGISPPNPLAVEFDVHARYDYRIRLSLVSNNRSTAGGDLLMMSANFYNATVQPQGGGVPVIIPLSYGHWVDLSSYITGPVVITKIGVSIMHIGSSARTWQSTSRPIVLDIERKLKPI